MLTFNFEIALVLILYFLQAKKVGAEGNCNYFNDSTSLNIIQSLIKLLNLNGDGSGYFDLRIYSDDDNHKDILRSYKWVKKIHKKINHIYSIQLTNIDSINSHDALDEDDADSQILVIVITQNVSRFFPKLKKIVERDEDNIVESLEENHHHHYHRHWKPKYFLLYPESISNPAETLYNDEKFGFVIKNISIIDEFYIVTWYTPNLNSEVLNNTDFRLSIWEIYSIGHVHFYQSVNLSKNCQLDWKYFNDKISRRKNFGNATIRAIAPKDPLYEAEIRFDKTTEEVKFKNGTSVGMLKYIAEGLNFTDFAMIGSWISESVNANGTNEIGGDGLFIKLGMADISIEQTTITSRRRKHVHFLHPTYFYGVDAFFVQPPVSTARNLYTAPFKFDLWVTMVLSWILLIITMKICAWIRSLVADIDDPNDSEITSDVFLWAVGAICQQGWHVQPVSMSLRIVFITGYITGLVCFVAFSAAIVSLLSVKVVPIKSMEDLTAQSFHLYTSKFTFPTLDGLSHLMEHQPGYPKSNLMEEADSIQRITKSKSAILAYPDIFNVELHKLLNRTNSEKYVCDTYSSVPASKTPFRSGMMVNKKSPFIEFFNYQILVLRNSGLNHRYMTEYIRHTQVKCLSFTTGYKQALEILDVIMALYILMIGYGLSLTFLCGEIIIGRHKVTYALTI